MSLDEVMMADEGLRRPFSFSSSCTFDDVVQFCWRDSNESMVIRYKLSLRVGSKVADTDKLSISKYATESSSQFSSRKRGLRVSSTLSHSFSLFNRVHASIFLEIIHLLR